MTNIPLKSVVAGVAFGFAVWCVVSMRVEVPVSAAGSCEGLMSLKLPSTTITIGESGAGPAPDVKISLAHLARSLFPNPAASRQR